MEIIRFLSSGGGIAISASLAIGETGYTQIKFKWS